MCLDHGWERERLWMDIVDDERLIDMGPTLIR